MLTALAIIVSAVLYRIPRGGPDPEAWKPIFGRALDPPGGTIWAASTTLMLGFLTGIEWWAAAILYLCLELGERLADYQKHVDGNTHEIEVLPMCLKGLRLLNPFMGLIYLACREAKLPKFPPWIDGFTAWAEFFSGLVTATSYACVFYVVSLYV